MRQRHKRALVNALRTLPRTLEALYDAIILRIEQCHEDDVRLVKRALAWVHFSRRSISMDLLQYALAIQDGDTSIDQDACVDDDLLLSLCAGLINMEPESAIVRFIHPTISNYFERFFEHQLADQHAQILSACVTFFLSDTFKKMEPAEIDCLYALPSRSDATDHIVNEDMRTKDFLVYATNHIQEHYLFDEATPYLQRLFSNDEALRLYWNCRIQCRANPCGWTLSQIHNTDKITMAAYLGLLRILDWLIDSGISPHAQDSTGQTALYAAASQDNTETAGLLLARGVDPDRTSFDTLENFKIDSNVQRFCRTPLHCALLRGNMTMAQLLLNHGAKLQNSAFPSDTSTQIVSPLRIAIQSKSREMVNFVLKYRPQDINGSGRVGEDPPLHEAIALGADEVVEVLLKNGANGLCENRRGQSPLEAAITAPMWRVSDGQCRSICEHVLKHTPKDCWSLRPFSYRGWHWTEMPNRRETHRYLRIMGFWVSSRGYGSRRKSI